MSIPIVLFVYKRANHLKRTLNSLKKEKKIKKIYFFCDGPKDSSSLKEKKEIAKCLNLVNKVKWAKKTVVIQKKNIGLRKSLFVSTKYVFFKYKHEFAVFLEDDNVILPGFYDFMNLCSKKFKNNKKVFSVTGYNYLLKKNLYNSVKGSHFFLNVTCTWSIGIWKRSWKEWKKQISLLGKTPKRHVFKDILKEKNYFLYDALLEGYGKPSNAGSTFAYTSWKYNFLNVYPKYPLINNTGMDGTGENCASTSEFINSKKFPKNHKIKIDNTKVKLNHKVNEGVMIKLKLSKKKILFYKYFSLELQNFLLKCYQGLRKLI